jgi:hypothetical protein
MVKSLLVTINSLGCPYNNIKLRKSKLSLKGISYSKRLVTLLTNR